MCQAELTSRQTYTRMVSEAAGCDGGRIPWERPPGFWLGGDMHDWGPGELSSAASPSPWRRGDERRSTRRALLADVLKSEILPRLAAKRRPIAAEMARGAIPADPAALAQWCLVGEAAPARAALAARLASGACAQSVMLEDIGPAARRLGRMWENDDCDFLDVTVAAHALVGLVRAVAPEERARAAGAPSLIISLAPGETHALGADIAAAMFRCAGWWALRCDGGEMRAALARENFDAAGFSVSCDRYLPALAAAIAEARSASRNPRLKILVGGPVLASRPGLAESLGADLVVADGDERLAGTICRALRL